MAEMPLRGLEPASSESELVRLIVFVVVFVGALVGMIVYLRRKLPRDPEGSGSGPGEQEDRKEPPSP